ncbi:MAG TPA: hypothetical protein VK921_00510, partial [Anditalea sp.]|nr:hypothetical protein [Anditalea sp.]
MNKIISKSQNLLWSIILIASLTFLMGCSSLVEEAEAINESQNFYTELSVQLENMQWESNAPNARSSQAIPTFRVTISALQKLSVIQPAVLDQATVLIATDEAYSQ